jgi:hypothetical protein
MFQFDGFFLLLGEYFWSHFFITLIMNQLSQKLKLLGESKQMFYI